MPVNPRTALYILPNAITTAALFFGFYAILQAIGGNWRMSAIAVLLSALLDACDGHVARWTNTDSVFGIEYDSLSDTIAFGVAPAILFYQWQLHYLGNIGLAVTFCYCAATALRLARFNCQTRTTDRRYFIGIPSPAAALLAVSYVAVVDDKGIDMPIEASAVVCGLLAFTMVSSVRFHSLKGLNLRSRLSFHNGVILLIVGAVVLNAVADDFLLAVFCAMSFYFVFGYGMSMWSFVMRKRRNLPPTDS